jgi:hypothetical protein
MSKGKKRSAAPRNQVDHDYLLMHERGHRDLASFTTTASTRAFAEIGSGVEGMIGNALDRVWKTIGMADLRERVEHKFPEPPKQGSHLRLVGVMVQLLDLVLDPKKADEVIGDLLEQYPSRLALGSGHAKRWLVAQAAWIVFDRALDVIRQVAAARAGK